MVHLDLASLIRTIGLLGVAAVVFTESGLLIGLFLPSDSLLFAAGLLAAQGYLHIRWLVLACFAAAVAGDRAGYAVGLRVGRALFQHRDSRLVEQRSLEPTERSFLPHGGKAVTLARFVPIVRTRTPIVAGIGRMPYQRFVAFNLLGAALWAVGFTRAGYWLGNVIPSIDRYLLPIAVALVLASLAPTTLHLRREWPAILPHPARAGDPLPAKERDRTSPYPRKSSQCTRRGDSSRGASHCKSDEPTRPSGAFAALCGTSPRAPFPCSLAESDREPAILARSWDGRRRLWRSRP